MLLTVSCKVGLYLHFQRKCLALVEISSLKRVLPLVSEPSAPHGVAWLRIAQFVSFLPYQMD